MLYDPLLFTSDSSTPLSAGLGKSPHRLGFLQRSQSGWAGTSLGWPPEPVYTCTCPAPVPAPGSRLPQSRRGCAGGSPGTRPSPAPESWTWLHSRRLSALSCSRCKAIPSQLQALSIPGPAMMLYCLFPSAGRCRCSTCGCPELLALGIRDERPVTPRFMVRVWKISVLGRSCILEAISLCPIPSSCHPPPRFFPPLFLFPCERRLRATLGEGGDRVKWVCLPPPPATQLAVGLDVAVFLYFLSFYYFPGMDAIGWRG